MQPVKNFRCAGIPNDVCGNHSPCKISSQSINGGEAHTGQPEQHVELKSGIAHYHISVVIGVSNNDVDHK
jgi:hypothetical protein